MSSQREEGDEGNHNWWLGLCSEVTLSFLPTANIQASHVAAPTPKGSEEHTVLLCMCVYLCVEGKKGRSWGRP